MQTAGYKRSLATLRSFFYSKAFIMATKSRCSVNSAKLSLRSELNNSSFRSPEQNASIQTVEAGQPITEMIRAINKGGATKLVKEYIDLIAEDQAFPTTHFDDHPHLNRWRDIKCYDHSRVSLGPPNDYIHGNYVDGLTQPRKFICTQGPLKVTLVDFWRMVWQEGVVVIVSLTKLEGKKCERYFPDKALTAYKYGAIKVQNQRVMNMDDSYNMTTLTISRGKNSKKRTLCHFQFYAWPDKATPESSKDFLKLLDSMNKLWKILTQRAISEEHWTDTNLRPPIIVHCSAGVGRTGTLVALDVITERLHRTQTSTSPPLVEVYETVKKMRTQRHMCVQRPEQYVFLFLGVVDHAQRKSLVHPSDINVNAFLMDYNDGENQAFDEEK